MPIDRESVERLMKRCQIGVGGRNALDAAHDIMAECYGTLGALCAENERLRAEVAAERERCAVTAEECSCECCCTPDEIAMAEYIAGKIREPNADVVRLDAAGGQSERT